MNSPYIAIMWWQEVSVAIPATFQYMSGDLIATDFRQ
jgi:hypothetical protein